MPSLQDIKRCLNALEELGTLQVTSHILQKHTDVVATLKKVRGGLIAGWREGGDTLGLPRRVPAPPPPRGCRRSVATKPTKK